MRAVHQHDDHTSSYSTPPLPTYVGRQLLSGFGAGSSSTGLALGLRNMA